MSNMEYGYVRVSSKDQRPDRQINALLGAGLHENNIIVEKQSGKDFHRREYEALIGKLHSRDVLYVLSLDRLGRNYHEIIEQWQHITRDIGADIVVLDMPLLDTRNRARDLTGTFVTDMVLQILSYVAQIERENIRTRQAEGIAAAKAKGVRFGRRSKPLPENFNEIASLWRSKQISLDEALSRLRVSRTYFYQHLRDASR